MSTRLRLFQLLLGIAVSSGTIAFAFQTERSVPALGNSPQTLTGAADGAPPVWKCDFDPVCESIVDALGRLSALDEEGQPPLAFPRSTLSWSFVETGELPEGDGPSEVQFTPDGAEIVIAHRDTHNLVFFDAATSAYLREVVVSGSPGGFAISPDGLTAVTANLWEDTASIVDLTTYTEVAVVPIGDQPGVVRITPDSATAVVGNTVDSSLSVINIATATEVRRITGVGFVGSLSVNFEPGAIGLSFSTFECADNTTVIQPDYYADTIQFVDISTGTVNGVASNAHPRGVAVTPDGTKAVVSHTYPGQEITVLDVATQSISKTINVGSDLQGPISIRPNGNKAAVAVLNACRVVNLNTDAVSGDLATASVYQLITTANGQYALGVGYYGSLIDYAGQTIVANLNNIVSTSLGAASPVDDRAAMVATTFGADMIVVNTNGASGFVEAQVPSGPPPEADATRVAAITPDGTKVVVSNLFSDTASILDAATQSVLAVVNVGDRTADVAITPDGTKAVVANLDSTFASVIDLSTYAVTNVGISTRGSEVEIAPDGSYAYVAVVSSDGVWRIDMNTLTTSGGKLLTGNMGSVGFLHQQASGMTISHDGATLVTCNTFDFTSTGVADTISIIDTATWTELTRVTVGDYPVRATFSADDSTIYITNKNDDTISVVDNAGAASSVTDTISVGDQPFEMAVEPDGSRLYVLNYNDHEVGVVDLGTNTMTNTIGLPNAPAGIHLNADRDELYVPTGTWSISFGPGPKVAISASGEFTVIDTNSESVSEQVSTGHPPSNLAVNDAVGVAVVPSPFHDGAVFVQIAAPCPSDLNGDHQTDLTDLGILLGNYGTGTLPEQGDLDGSGTIDLTDLGLLLGAYGMPCP